MQAVKNALRMLYAWLDSGRFLDLVSSRHHTPYLTRHRLTAIVTRIRLVSVAFSVLTLAWIPFDILTLAGDRWHFLAICRIAAAAVFIRLAIASEQEYSRGRTLMMLGFVLVTPLALYGVAQSLFVGTSLHGLAAINSRLYDSLPVIVLAGLSIFPLIASEGIFFALIIALAVAGIQLFLVGISAIELFSMLWVLMLALGVYLLACAIQLHYMMALLRRASHDALTGALTRRSGVEVLDLHFGLACEQEAPLTVIFLDADNFKSINDAFGHEAGDEALRDIVVRLHQHLRQADVVIRWGGEEFVVILTNTPMNGAAIVVDRIMVDWFGVRPDGGLLTASMGLAERMTDGANDWSELIALADERMYLAKTSGKACCVNHAGVIRRPGPG